MALATLSIDIEARLARLEEGLDKAARINAKAASDVERRWQGASTAIKAALAPLAAAFSVDALRQFVITNAQAIDSLNDIADATGSTVEKISALQDVARRTGTDIGTVDTALIKLNQALSAAKPDSDQAKALKAIGLSAAELKALDPAEALRKVAVALSGFADDGNKARLVQELFGKSLREVAPLLKDLATQTELVGSVTKEQADQAERFVHALGQFEAASTKARQGLVSTLLPALTEFIQRANIAREALNGLSLGDRFSASNDNFSVDRPAEAIRHYRAEIEKLQGTLARINSGDERRFALLTGTDRVPIVERQLENLRKLEAFYTRFSALKAPNDPSQVDPSLLDTRAINLRSLPDIGGGGTAKRGIAADLDFRRSEIAGTEKVNNDLRLAQYDEYLKDRKARVDAEIQQNKQVLEFIDQQREEEEARERAAAEGPKKKIEELSEFAKRAQRNIQDALGDTLEQVLGGHFDSIGKLWASLLQRMVAQALAAQLNEKLFGKRGTDGAADTPGLLTDLFKWFGGSFAVGSQSIPRDMLAFVHQGERIVPAHQNRSGESSGALRPITLIDQRTINVDVASRTEVLQAIAASDARRSAELARQARRGEGAFR